MALYPNMTTEELLRKIDNLRRTVDVEMEEAESHKKVAASCYRKINLIKQALYERGWKG